MAEQSRIAQLAAIISENTGLVDAYFRKHNLPTPSLDHHAPDRLPIPGDAPHVEEARKAVLEATNELRALMTGAADLLRPLCTANVPLHAIVRFNIAKAFPIGERATFGQIAKQVGLPERQVRALLRYGMLDRLFREPESGVVEHTALTRVLAEDADVHARIEYTLDELWSPAPKVADALARWPDSQEPNETAFALAHNTDKTMYEVFSSDSVRALKFAKGMKAMNSIYTYDTRHLIDEFPWADLPKDGTIADVGGSLGAVMIGVAREIPRLKFVIQDLPNVVEEGKQALPHDLEDRIEFMSHDFFTDQPTVAHVYYLRSIFHNWPDKYCIKILQYLRPSLRRGAYVVLHELILAEPNSLPPSQELTVRHMDVLMLQLLNSYQRSRQEWENLFQKADPRYKVLKITTPSGNNKALMILQWTG